MENTRRSGKNPLNGVKAKKKMTKSQMQVALAKKKECDAAALVIVERLVETNVDEQWLLENLKHINRCHMEDVTEERAITKLCGYILCDKPLTVIIKQQYHISTKSNKVYDVSKRKNFCSSKCYGATNFLLEQMLTSPLWLRDKEEIPDFQLLSLETEKKKHLLGEEVNFQDVHSEVDSITKDMKNCKVLESEETTEAFMVVDNLQTEPCEEADIANTSTNVEGFLQNGAEIEILSSSNHENDVKIELSNLSSNSTCTKTINLSIKQNIPEKKSEPIVIIKDSSNKTNTVKTNSTTPQVELQTNSTVDNKPRSKKKSNARNKDRKHAKSTIPPNLSENVEKNFQEWITEDTLRLVLGDEAERQKILENITNKQKYGALCEKLHRLEMQEAREDRATLEKPSLKPAPHYHILQREGKTLELKVHAFYKGKTVMDPPEEKSNESLKKETDSAGTVMPLTDAHNPHAIRRRIFLDKLNAVLPDLLRTLAGGGQGLPATTYNYSSERSSTVKALVSTFSLSAKNVVFKTAEWTLVGLIIIKMLSVLDPWLRKLLSMNQAAMYVSMILMTYKLDPNYLDNLLVSLSDRRLAS